MPQPSTLPLLRGETTLESALVQEEDMLLDLSYPDQRVDFFVWLYSHRSEIEDTVSHHLGLGPRNCRVGGVNEWIYGSFNVCLPVYVDQWTTGKRVLVRFPLPYKVGESTCPGNADEKLRCEAATFIWIQEHGYAVPIPRLWGYDSRIRRQPNSVNDEDDARAQMANLAAMRALLPHFTDRKLRQGPFLYRLTDLHQSNIFVDSNWRIKCLVDLEWACSLPAETLRPPYWLTGRPVDDLIGEHHEASNNTYHEFVDIFEEEKSMNHDCSYRSSIMRKSWEIGAFWYFHALDSPKGLFNIFRDHIQPLFSESHRSDPDYPRIVSEYWAKDMEEVVAAKLRDRETYESALRRRFEDASDSSC